jgi:hypothetical protein
VVSSGVEESLLIQRHHVSSFALRLFLFPTPQNHFDHIINTPLPPIALFYRFLIKETINRSATFPKFQNYGIQYIWHKICFFTSWTPSGKIRILCFDLPASLQESIIYSARENSELGEGNGAIGALAMNNILVEETVGLFEKSVWSWRHVIRDLEMVVSLLFLSPNFSSYYLIFLLLFPLFSFFG